MSDVNKISDLVIDELYTNEQLKKVFFVSQSGGIRYSSLNKALVLLHDPNPSNNPYGDKWNPEHTVLYYHGTDADSDGGDQVTYGKGSPNRHIWNTWYGTDEQRKVRMYLFERVSKPKKANKFKGQVYLASEPTYEKLESSGRKVFIFPLAFSNRSANACDKAREKLVDEAYEKALSDAKQKTLEELEKYSKAKNEDSTPGRHDSKPRSTYVRDPNIVILAHKRADGRCDLCGEDAPFKNKKGEPFLEVHHIVWLSKGGPDNGTNVVALCPNCHRKVHNLKLDADINSMKMKAQEYSARYE